MTILLALSALWHSLFFSPQSLPFPGPGGGVGGASGTTFITSFTGGTTRNNFPDLVGGRITVGGSNVVVTHLGRRCVSGNSETHTLHIVKGTASYDDLASGSVNMSGCTSGVFTYAAVSYTLLASTMYFIVSDETDTGDSWAENDATIAVTSVATLDGAAYGIISAMNFVSGANTMYVPVDFKY